MLAARENLTVRQLAQRLGGYGGLALVGTPQTIADEMEEWLMSRGCDGFNIMFPYLPGGLDDFVERRWGRAGGGGFIGKSKKAGRFCGRIWGCRGRKTGSLRVNLPPIQAGFCPENLDFERSEARLRANAGRFGRRLISPYLRF